MRKWEVVLIPTSATLLEAIEVIDNSGFQVAVVADSNNKLLGLVTDGDIRRALLKTGDLKGSVAENMNTNPKVCSPGTSKREILDLMKIHSCHQIPIVDHTGVMLDIVLLDDLVSAERKENAVVLMAGGLGSRLGNLTKDTPKPLLKVGGKPILESIIENLVLHGFYKLHLSVNYQADKIKSYFGNGERWGVEIHYLEESEKLGTAGPISLVSGSLEHPFIVMNGDLLTDVNLQQMLQFHETHQASATMCVRKVAFQIPYGVVHLDNQRIKKIDEKPSQDFFVNAGIYIFDGDVKNKIPSNQYFDMNILFDRLLEEKKKCQAFPIREYWLDIGQKEDFRQANLDYQKVFGPEKTNGSN